mgnify:FL=1
MAFSTSGANGTKPPPNLTERKFRGYWESTVLAFSTSGANGTKPPRNLTERRFRGYWESTDKGDNDRQRFAEAMRPEDMESTPPSPAST